MTVRLDPMAQSRLADWIETRHARYIESRMLAGESREVATQKAVDSRQENFPGDRPLDTHLVFDVRADDTVVGHLWRGPSPSGATEWWVFDIEIDEAHRRRGYARRALELGHAAVKHRGATAIGLNVFGYNAVAKDLYSALGYAVTATQMKKPL
ncbi:GNAT family N-acetyltransferase [Conyzicola sp.]|uniref:GNAT family N-acetyltransferase n=1 Tax=Conyzicola sp. TaxID=1969404 RepID=UPI0039891997